MKRCTNCSAECDDSAKFCPQCASPLLAPITESLAADTLYCRFCGAENQGDNIFCKKCGKRISESALAPESSLQSSDNSHSSAFDIGNGSGITCPSCGKSGFCHAIAKSNVKVSGGGYSFWDGCCGMVLLGPSGLLCGACGNSTKVNVRNETWFVCENCGTEFISKQSALNNAVLSMRSAALYTAFLSFGIGNEWNGGEKSLIILCLAIIAAIWCSIFLSISRAAKQSFSTLFSESDKAFFWTRFFFYLAASMIVGFFVGL